MKDKKQRNIAFLLILMLGVTIGFALLSTTLKINGTAGIKSNTWDIHWENVVPNQQSTVQAQTPTIGENATKVTYEVELSLPGDFYEFTVDAVNDGSINGIIDDVRHSVKEVTIVNNEEVETTATLPSYIHATLYYDGTTTEPAEGDILEAGDTQTYVVRIEYDSLAEVLPEADKVYRITDEIDYVQTKEAAKGPLDFETSPWEDIIDAYEDDPTQFQQDMEDGTTREVQLDLDNDGTAETTAHVRIANLSKCSNGESASACGFVLEFVEVIDEHRMNPWDNNYYPSTNGNASYGGWKYCEMKQYLNTTILNALPSDLQSAIITTPMISGHSNRESNNFTTNDDKLYLFGTREIWEEQGTFAQYFGIKVKDSAYDNERQLDYYRIKGNIAVPSANKFPVAEKKDLEGNASNWALRTAEYNSNFNFQIVATDGYYNTAISPNVAVGVSPAFRIAE